MKKVILQILLVSISIQLFAKEIDKSKAEMVATSFLGKSSLKSFKAIELKLLPEISPKGYPQNRLKSSKKALPYYYLFNINDDDGFIIISGDDCALPVLGYSNQGGIIIDSLPPAFIKWIEQYKKEIRLIRKHNISQSEIVKEKWEALKSTSKLKNGQDITSVDPLITTRWDQSPYYNEMCPRKYFWSSRAVVGCVATAMAQIMKYHNHPYKGVGFHPYTADDYGLLFVDFSSSLYDWVNMPNTLNATSTSTQVDAVARLCYHCGVSVDMNYGVDASGISSLEPVANALKDYFQYDNTVRFVKREDYSDEQWHNILRNELDNSRPIEYAGMGIGGGHAFVFDGYSEDYYHINWGWSGQNDGYFLLNVLDPSALGTGGGSGGYNDLHQAIIGIQPKIGTDYNLQLNSNITTTPSPIEQIFEFDVTVDIANAGTNNFTGDYCAVLFNQEGNFIDYIDILTGYTLTSGYHYINGLTFHSDGFSVYPDTYRIGVYYRVSGSNWIAIDGGSYQNFKSFSIVSPFPENEIKLYDSIKINPDPIVQGNSLNVWTDIANYSSTTYNGTIAAALYHLNGYLSEIINIDSTISLDAGYHYTNGINFNSTKIISDPGSYMIAIADVPDGSSNAYLVDPNTYLNPIFVNVTRPPLQPDIYEVNNSDSSPYNFNINFISDSVYYSTTGANIHEVEDFDYYKISLPQGNNYVINARLQDSYNSNNGNEYTCDGYLTYYVGSEWSEIYDDIVIEDIVLNNGGDVIFSIAPFFQGLIGTYDLEYSIKRNEITSQNISEINTYPEISIFPNPCTDYILIKYTNDIQKVELMDISGKLIYSKSIHDKSGKLNTSNYSNGVYLIRVYTSDKVHIQKLIKNE